MYLHHFFGTSTPAHICTSANVSNSLFLLEPCPISAHLAKKWLQRLSRQQVTFEYFSTSSRDTFLSWCNIKSSVDAGYGSESSDSDVLSYSSTSSMALSSHPLTSRSLVSSKTSRSIFSSSLLERPKSAVVRLFHSSNSGRRAIKSESGKFEVSVRARTADGYIHGVRSAIEDVQLLKPSAEEEEEIERKAVVAEVQKKSTPERPLTVNQFLNARKQSVETLELNPDQRPLETEHVLGLQAEVVHDTHATAGAVRNKTSRWDDAFHEAAHTHPSNHDWMDRNIRFAVVGNNHEFAVERELLNRDCFPRMKEAMWQLGYSLEMVMLLQS